MVILGLGLMILGGIAVLSALFVSEPGSGGELLGLDVTTLESFLVGVAAGAAILWGFAILKWGTRRSLAHRRERKELTELNQKLERVEAERRTEDPERHDTPADGGRAAGLSRARRAPRRSPSPPSTGRPDRPPRR